MSLVRLDKYLSDTGACSRSQARDRIRRGTFAVNGVTVTDPAAKLDSAIDTVFMDNKCLGREEHLYVMLHKSAGLLTATRDPRKPTVLDAMPEAWKRRGLFPVGRLDKDTTGLLLLIDDGEFAHRVISPKSHVSKLYLARVDGTPAAQDVEAFAAGIVLKDGTPCLPATLEILDDGFVRVEIFEGKYHQIKRMLASRGLPVVTLHRERIGGLCLDPALAPGEYRELSRPEIDRIAPHILSK